MTIVSKIQTWIQDSIVQDQDQDQDLLIQDQDQDQDQDFDVQDQDRDRDLRLTRPILEVHDRMDCDKQKVMASRKSSIQVVAHSKQKTSYYV